MTKKVLNTSKGDLKKKVEMIDSKAVRVNVASKQKAPLKAELSIKLKELQSRYDTLHNENKLNIEVIRKLELKVTQLEERNGIEIPANSPRVESISSQTDTVLACQKYDFKVDDIYEFYGHRWTEHEDDELGANEVGDVGHDDHDQALEENEVIEKNADNPISCNFCDDTFESIRSLMTHKKSTHKEKLSVCRNFSAGFCEFGDKLCWFSHSSQNGEPVVVNCNNCSETFHSLTDYLHHKKREHGDTVKECKNKECRYGEQSCWYHHANKVNLEKKDNQEITEKIFNMMETFTNRIVNIENRINNEN